MYITISKKIFVISLILLLLILDFCGACTVVVVDGEITDDGRPLFGKVRHPAIQTQRQYVARTTVYPIWYIAVNDAMGVNEAGFATTNAASTVIASGKSTDLDFATLGDSAVAHQGSFDTFLSGDASFYWPYDPATTVIDAGKLTINALAGCITMDDFHSHIDNIYENSNSNIQSCFGAIDAVGGSRMFEFNGNVWWREYEVTNPNRIAQNTYGFVVRENSWHFHDDGTDNIFVTGDRYETGRVNLQGMLSEKGYISLRLLARGTDGPNEGYEFYRYGPNRPLAPIADPRNRSSIIVHGVLSTEDPLLSTMWVGLGPSDYTIYVPTWVMIRTVPLSLEYNLSNPNQMFDRAYSLFNKGNELITQQSTFPFEEHVFNEVIDGLLPHWRAFGTPSRDVMERVCHRIAADAYSLLHCLDLMRYDNKAPRVDFDVLPDGMTLHFTLNAADSDGQIITVLWNFGDNTTNTVWSPSHNYDTSGDYLISCTVTDNEGVSNTKWMYYTVPFSGNLSGNNQVTLDDLSFLAQNWLTTCSEPLWCDNADINHSGKVDLMDLSILSNYWINQ